MHCGASGGRHGDGCMHVSLLGAGKDIKYKERCGSFSDSYIIIYPQRGDSAAAQGQDKENLLIND